MCEEGAGKVKTDYLDNKLMVEPLRSATAQLDKNHAMAQAALARPRRLGTGRAPRAARAAATATVAALGALALLGAPSRALGADGLASLAPAWLDVRWVGFSKWASQNMNVNDVSAAFKAFLLTVARKHGYDVSLQSSVCDDLPLFESALREQPINLVVIDAFSYLDMQHREALTPAFVGSLQNKVGFQYLVVTKRGGGFDSIAALRGRDILQGWIASSSEGLAWLETLLAAQRLGPRSSFFGKIEIAAKPATTILPVYFGSKPACVVDRGGFDLMAELNPRLGQELQAIAASQTIVDHLICLRPAPQNPPGFQAELTRILSDLHKEPAGQQILTLFRIDRLVPFEPAHLDNVRELRAVHEGSRAQPDP
jgi:ABC-type phosphate/phosphonate transport system substrate-binding protein